MAISHANCTHPRTPAGRRACRAGTASPAEMQVKIELGADTPDHAAERRARVTRLQTRLMNAADAPRIQPRRSGARVSATSSTCVQAALHSSRGLCACGHVSGGFVRAS